MTNSIIVMYIYQVPGKLCLGCQIKLQKGSDFSAVFLRTQNTEEFSTSAEGGNQKQGTIHTQIIGLKVYTHKRVTLNRQSTEDLKAVKTYDTVMVAVCHYVFV